MRSQRLSVTPEAMSMAQSRLASLEKEFMEADRLAWDKKMSVDRLCKVLEKTKLNTQMRLAMALNDVAPEGINTGVHQMGAELMAMVAGARHDLTNASFQLRPQTFVQGIESESLVANWADAAYPTCATRFQVDMDLSRGPWAAPDRLWLALVWASCHNLHLRPGTPRTVQIFTGVAAEDAVLHQLQRKHVYTTRTMLTVELPGDVVTKEVRQQALRQAIAAHRAAIGLVDNRDVQLRHYLTEEEEDRFEDVVNTAEVRCELEWTIDRLRLDVGESRLVCPSLGERFNYRRVVVAGWEYPKLVLYATELMQSSGSWLSKYKIEGDYPGCRVICEDSDKKSEPVQEAIASLYRYWAYECRGLGMVNRALATAAGRLVSTAGSGELSGKVLDMRGRGYPNDRMAVFAPNCHRQVPTRMAIKVAGVSPLVPWAIRNNKLVRYNEEVPGFDRSREGVRTALQRTATILSMCCDQELAHVQLSNEATFYGAGWQSVPTWGTEVGREIIQKFEKIHSVAWNQSFGRTVAEEVSFIDKQVDWSPTGSWLLQNVDALVGPQRVPVFCWGLYSDRSYLPHNEAPTLGGKVLVRAHNCRELNLCGQHFDITSHVASGKATYVTFPGTDEDGSTKPYPLGFDHHGAYMQCIASSICADVFNAIGSAAPECRQQNAALCTVPWVKLDSGTIEGSRLLVKARSPPQPGGLVPIGTPSYPAWVADAPSDARVPVERDVLSRFEGMTAFRR